MALEWGSHHVCTCIFYKSLSKKQNKNKKQQPRDRNQSHNSGSYLSVCDLSFLSQSFWWSENPCLPLLNELGPAEVGVSLKEHRKKIIMKEVIHIVK